MSTTLSTWDASCILPNTILEQIDKLELLLNNSIIKTDLKADTKINNNSIANTTNINNNNNNQTDILTSLSNYDISLKTCLSNLNTLKLYYNNLDISYNNVYLKTEEIRLDCTELLNQKDILLNKSKDLNKGLILFDNIDQFIKSIKDINYLQNTTLEQENNISSNNTPLPHILVPIIKEEQYLNTLATLEKFIISIEEHVINFF